MTKNPAQVHKKESYHHGDLRQQLVNATRLLVEEKGSMGFSVAEAAREAGVSTAAPYRHFTDRTAMLEAVAIQGMHRMGHAFDEAMDPFEDGTLDAISALGSAYVAFAKAEPGVFRLMFAAHGDASDEIMEAGQACYARLQRQVADLMGRAEIDDDVMAACLPLWTFVHGAAFLTIDAKLDKGGVDVPMDSLIRGSTAKLLCIEE